MLAQAPLERSAEQIKAQVASQGLTGFTSVTLDADVNTLRLYWKGAAVPSALAQTIASIRRTGITLEVINARYSLAELTAEIDAIIADQARMRVPDEYRATQLVPLFDGSGIAVTVPERNEQESHILAQHAVTAIVVEGGSVPLGRTDDIPAYDGGARVQISYGPGTTGFEECTSGFGVSRNGSNSFLLSAGHCGVAPNLVVNGTYVAMGSVAATVRPGLGSDTMLINVSSSSRSIFDGAWNEVSRTFDNTSVAVTGQTGDVVGSQVCTSGSFSGRRCSIEITAVNVTEELDGHYVDGLTIGQRTDATNAAGQGDSGGPVFTYAGPASAVARGIISSGFSNYEVFCTGITANDRRCFSRIVWVPIAMALDDFDATLNR
jgi:hypothetical protein